MCAPELSDEIIREWRLMITIHGSMLTATICQQHAHRSHGHKHGFIEWFRIGRRREYRTHSGRPAF